MVAYAIFGDTCGNLIRIIDFKKWSHGRLQAAAPAAGCRYRRLIGEYLYFILNLNFESP